ncbi:MAG TPA: ECF transporter S component [Nitrososphaerales archaeon]|nr:ECF transporter S component [Nitrososphaerales archaeon]
MADLRRVAGAAVFTAFIFVATAAFSAGIPATNGYFNVGEIMVYTTALLMGPYVGAVAGGVGSMLSDIFLGFPLFAPGTLVIKATEGFIVGYLGNRALRNISGKAWRSITAALALVVGLIIGYVGAAYWTGNYQLSLGFPVGPQLNAAFTVPASFWLGLGGLAFVIILAVGLTVDARLGWTTLSVLAGGSEMVLGYFVYESILLGLGFVSAAGEVPFNIAQAVVGLIVSIPLVRSIKRVIPKRGTGLEINPSPSPNPQ